MPSAEETLFGLPKEVRYCKRCVMSNQRPASIPEFKHTRDRKGAKYMHIDENGICDACRYAEKKENIDWKGREKEFLDLLDQYRRNDGEYDCIVPGSGGKDSAYAAHVLKYKYGMNPLTVTWPPILYTDIGWKNFRNWIEIGGFDNITFKPNGKVQRLLTKLSIENLLHPFQTFILGQKHLPPKLAMKYGVPLIFYGESEAEYGNPIAENNTSLRDKSYYAMNNLSECMIAGIPIPELIEKYKIRLNDLMSYLPAHADELDRHKVDVRYLGYYLKWTPQECYYYSVEHTGFETNTIRTEGTYSKYVSLDDKIDGFHFYTTYIKFGIGRTTYESSQEIRNKHLTREEAIALVKKFDGEFPQRYFDDVMGYLDIKPERFHEICDEFRSPHLWCKEDGKWKLRHPVS